MSPLGRCPVEMGAIVFKTLEAEFRQTLTQTLADGPVDPAKAPPAQPESWKAPLEEPHTVLVPNRWPTRGRHGAPR